MKGILERLGKYKEIKNSNFSDLFFIYGQNAKIKVNGILYDLIFPDIGKPIKVDKHFIKGFIEDYIYPKGITEEDLMHETDIDLNIEVPEFSFRTNMFRTKSNWSFVLRNIPTKIPKFESLGLPSYIRDDVLMYNSGLILLTGVTGSGKSTTIAALINEFNQRYPKHILTIEDPIEFIHKPIKSLITQREIGVDVPNFPVALRSAMREAPNIILVGEMRDKETIEYTLKAAETGHLVFSTVHTYSASQTIERILSYFNDNEKKQIRYSLANILKIIISQKLITGKDRKLHLAYEILYNSVPVSANIREEKIHLIMQTAKNDPNYRLKNVTLNESLISLVKKGIIDKQEAYIQAYNKDEIANELNLKY